MAKKGTYYAGRVLKLGLLDQETLLASIKKPVSILNRGSAWTFINVEEVNQSGHHFVFGRLTKFFPQGQVEVVDEATRSEVTQIEPNLVDASSPFVYIPEYSGIAFLNISSKITPSIFINRFSQIIEHTNKNFFVDCDIELISDLKTFAAKLATLDGIYRISAHISPPNPLFSPLWKTLEDYLRSRNTDRMVITEDASESEALDTELPALVAEASMQTEEIQYIPEEEIAIGDAAILMAADGYGNGTIRGRRNEELVVIKTSETAMNFSFDKTPEPYELYLKVLAIFNKIKEQRHMEHGE